jgi:CRISPR-associated protein Cas2
MKRELLDLVVSYDIVNDRMRQKIADLLEDDEEWVQRSVFELTLKVKGLPKLRAHLGKCLGDKRDSIRYYILCQRCLPEQIVDHRQRKETEKSSANTDHSIESETGFLLDTGRPTAGV